MTQSIPMDHKHMVIKGLHYIIKIVLAHSYK